MPYVVACLLRSATCSWFSSSTSTSTSTGGGGGRTFSSLLPTPAQRRQSPPRPVLTDVRDDLVLISVAVFLGVVLLAPPLGRVLQLGHGAVLVGVADRGLFLGQPEPEADTFSTPAPPGAPALPSPPLLSPRSASPSPVERELGLVAKQVALAGGQGRPPTPAHFFFSSSLGFWRPP